MAEDNKNLQEEAVVAETEAPKADKKSNKPIAKKPNFFVRVWKKLKKLCKETVSELKKVVWTPKQELKKNTILVIVTVIAVGVAIAVVDTLSSWIVNSLASLIG